PVRCNQGKCMKRKDVHRLPWAGCETPSTAAQRRLRPAQFLVRDSRDPTTDVGRASRCCQPRGSLPSGPRGGQWSLAGSYSWTSSACRLGPPPLREVRELCRLLYVCRETARRR